jgi:hypothetical protein
VPPTQVPAVQVSAPLQTVASAHELPSGFAGFEQTPVDASQVPATWQASEATQTTGLSPVQAPAWHVSVCVQALPSLQALPLGLAGLEQTPVAVSQVPASWHWSDAVHTTGLPPVHAPAWHVSVCVQAFESLHVAPFALAGFEQRPVLGLQVPASWHWSDAVHTTGVPATHEPVALQTSAPLHAFPSVQLVPAGIGVCCCWPFASQVSAVQGLLSLCGVQAGGG